MVKAGIAIRDPPEPINPIVAPINIPTITEIDRIIPLWDSSC
jgi:hypothetical protein